MIEARVFETSDAEDEMIRKFAQNRVLKKRAAVTAGRNDVDMAELKALRKKVAVLEVAQHSLKTKLKNVRAQNDLEMRDMRLRIQKTME